MKKRLTAATAAIITLAGTCVLAGPALADPTDNPQSGDTTLSATVGSTFMLTIPTDTTIAYGQASTVLDGGLKVTGNVNQQKVVVTASAGDLAATDRKDGATIEYALQTTVHGEAVEYPEQGITWTEPELRDGYLDDSNAIVRRLTVGIDNEAWRTAKAGTYRGTVTFTATMQQAVAD